MPSRFEYERAIRASELKPPSRHLALTIATWADVRTGIIPDRLQPSLTVLEGATGLSRATVRTHLTVLEKGGWLHRDRPTVAKARVEKERTKYQLLIPKTAVLPVEDEPEARAGAALADETLGQELPQPRAGAALELGQEMTPARAGAALSSSSSSESAVEYLPQPAAVAKPTSGRGEIQPLIDAMEHRGMRVSWTFNSEQWIELRAAIRRVGVATLVDHAERAWKAARTQPFSARYFLQGWAGLQATTYTGPQAVTGPPSAAEEYLADMQQIANELRAKRTAGGA